MGIFERHSAYFPLILMAVLSLSVALLFSFLIYPAFGQQAGAVLDPDQYGVLGTGLWRNGCLSYYPETTPTLERGPLYPALIAGLLFLTRGSYPQSVQFFHCLLFSATVSLVYALSLKMWNKRTALIASLACLCYPFLIWYVPRIWVEILTVFLFTALVFSLRLFFTRPRLGRALLTGALSGLCILAKGTFLPYLFLLPLLLFLTGKQRFKLRQLLVIFLIPLLMTGLWSWRNYRLTGKIIPVHLLAGYNLYLGNEITQNFNAHPFAYAALFSQAQEPMQKILAREVPQGTTGFQQEILRDEAFLQNALHQLRTHPLLLPHKILLNSLLFWTMGETRLKSLVIALLQLPVLLLCIVGILKTARQAPQRSLHGLILMVLALYYLLHLPILAIARFSVVLIPTLLCYGAAGLDSWLGQLNAGKDAKRSAIL